MKVKHPQAGIGTVRSVGENVAEIRFGDGTRRIRPQTAELEPVEPVPTVAEEQAGGGVSKPIDEIIRDTVEEVLSQLNLETEIPAFSGLAERWRGGRLVLKPADVALQSKDLDLETFFHKIVMMRNNLRTLEQKLNSSTSLSEGEKFELQQYITRCYGSMTTFNVLFKSKDDHFSTK